MKLIKAESRAYVLIIPKEGDDDACKVIYAQYIDAKGQIPVSVIDKTIPRGLKFVFKAREKFNRDEEIDKIEWGKMINKMRHGYKQEEYLSGENAMIESVLNRMVNVNVDR